MYTYEAVTSVGNFGEMLQSTKNVWYFYYFTKLGFKRKTLFIITVSEIVPYACSMYLLLLYNALRDVHWQ